MHARLMIALVALLTAVLAVAGCGGDDSDANGGSDGSAEVTVTTSSLSKAQFVKKANTICEKEKQELPERTQTFVTNNPSVDPSTAEGYTKGIKAVILPTVQGEIDKVSALGAPKGEEQNIEELLTAQQEAVNEVEEQSTFGSSKEVAEHFTDATKLMKKYGLDNCALISEPYRAAAGLPEEK